MSNCFLRACVVWKPGIRRTDRDEWSSKHVERARAEHHKHNIYHPAAVSSPRDPPSGQLQWRSFRCAPLANLFANEKACSALPTDRTPLGNSIPRNNAPLSTVYTSSSTTITFALFQARQVSRCCTCMLCSGQFLKTCISQGSVATHFTCLFQIFRRVYQLNIFENRSKSGNRPINQSKKNVEVAYVMQTTARSIWTIVYWYAFESLRTMHHAGCERA